MSLAGAMDTLAWGRLFWAWLQDVNCEWRLGDKTLLKLPAAYSAIKDDDTLEDPSESLTRNLEKLKKLQTSGEIVSTDCKSLYDLISRNATPSCQEFRTILQTMLIKEHLATGVYVRWVPSAAQIADALTKIMDNLVLRKCLRIGKYLLHNENAILENRSDARSRLQWLRGEEKPKNHNSIA